MGVGDRLRPGEAVTARYAAGVSYWRDPEVEAAPRATKLLLLSPGGVAGYADRVSLTISPTVSYRDGR